MGTKGFPLRSFGRAHLSLCVAASVLAFGCAGPPQSGQTPLPPGSGKIASVQKPKEALLDDRKNSPIWLSDIQMRPNFSTPAGQPPLKLCATPPSQPEKRVGAELLVSVIDHSGAAIRDLKQPDFVVYSESQRFQIDSFASSGAPTSIVLAIDSSWSMQSKLENVQKTLTTFLNAFR